MAFSFSVVSQLSRSHPAEQTLSTGMFTPFARGGGLSTCAHVKPEWSQLSVVSQLSLSHSAEQTLGVRYVYPVCSPHPLVLVSNLSGLLLLHPYSSPFGPLHQIHHSESITRQRKASNPCGEPSSPRDPPWGALTFQVLRTGKARSRYSILCRPDLSF